MSINGIVAGPTLGLFTLGMFSPWISSRTAVAGFLSGLATGIMLYAFNDPTQEFTKLLNGKICIYIHFFYEKNSFACGAFFAIILLMFISSKRNKGRFKESDRKNLIKKNIKKAHLVYINE